MKSGYILGLFTALICFSQSLFADSPITSTAIRKAYHTTDIVQQASLYQGLLTVELMEYLVDNQNPVEYKIALINELGWDFRGKDNAALFFEYLKEHYNFSNTEDFLLHASGDLIISLAYLKAMDNYFDVDEAIVYAKKAKEKSQNSFTVSMIYALIEAQKVMESDWCEVYNRVQQVRTDESLNQDMKPQAVEIIFEYIDLYKSYCR